MIEIKTSACWTDEYAEKVKTRAWELHKKMITEFGRYDLDDVWTMWTSSTDELDKDTWRAIGLGMIKSKRWRYGL